ncbi:hypothetical protein [Dysgonomonas sp. GY617]|uniref:hypothetical protein n=1 Tax=Dysgonomonas sp. GY617 TaxID=2780420 RepID=UPI0018844895|nr:hypothetical protein [Dysgonomonas sp. GY617]MBF0576889.1 hypothetical protein [Dysgonomonas sp. GY617]
MKNIHFIPKEFNEIKLGYYETIENECSPTFLNGEITLNTITINTPEKIVYKLHSDNFTPVIPVCAAYIISLRRGFKYHKLSAKMLHIRKLDEETVYSGEIIDKDRQYEHPEPHPRQRERERERIAKEEEAQKYNDNELNEGQAGGGYMNVNLMEYIDIPFKPGKYEVYLSFCGLESNHTIVEIVEE